MSIHTKDPDGARSSGPATNDSTDLVFDFSEVGRIDLSGLTMILTARELLHEENRRIWVAGLPSGFWSSMEAMGLEGYFTPLPRKGGIRA